MEKQKTNSYTLPADGEWQTILPGLEGFSAFEITGYAQGIKGSGKYSVIHSIALNACNGKGRIGSKCDYYGWQWWKRMKIRWIGNSFNYQLQIRTCSNYGKDGRIVVFVNRLIKDEFEHIEQPPPLSVVCNYAEIFFDKSILNPVTWFTEKMLYLK